MEGVALTPYDASKIQRWDPPKSLAQMASESVGADGVRCPGCGRQLFAYKTETGKTRIIRYEECRTEGCNRKFKTKQPHRVIIEEIKPKEVSSSGIAPDG